MLAGSLVLCRDPLKDLEKINRFVKILRIVYPQLGRKNNDKQIVLMLIVNWFALFQSSLLKRKISVPRLNDSICSLFIARSLSTKSA